MRMNGNRKLVAAFNRQSPLIPFDGIRLPRAKDGQRGKADRH
jgi:hypothetical protein